MVIVSICYGLGNQMCQYAAARALSLRTKSTLILDNSYFSHRSKYKKIAHQIYGLDFFGISHHELKNPIHTYWIKGIIKKISIKRLFIYFTESKSLEYLPEVINNKSRLIYLDGIFQNEKYFAGAADTIRKDFTFKDIDPVNLKIGKQMQNCQSVSLHVRRQEFANKSNYGVSPVEYYEKAIQYINDRVQNPVYYFFSDEMEWVKENLPQLDNCVYITHNTDANSYKDMYLMTQCKHNIIANSSFSWWGAWLNNNPDKIIIVPVGWLPKQGVLSVDLVPESWVIM